MATRIIEYGNTGALGRAFDVVPADQQITEQSAMTATSISAQSAAFDANTRMVLVQSDEAVSVKVGLSPTAASTSYRLNAGGEQYFSAQQNKGWQVAIKL